MTLATTTRTAPNYIEIEEGFPAKFAFSNLAGANFWEKTLKPHGIQATPIDISTMWNVVWMTKAMSKLVEALDIVIVAGWSPQILVTDIMGLIGVNQVCTVHFPDHSAVNLWCALQKFDPSPLAPKTHPEGTLTITVTNCDTNYIEHGPEYNASAGTP